MTAPAFPEVAQLADRANQLMREVFTLADQVDAAGREDLYWDLRSTGNTLDRAARALARYASAERRKTAAVARHEAQAEATATEQSRRFAQDMDGA
jgi:hypothetical protein